MPDILEKLSVGDLHSLGRSGEVARDVLAQPDLIDALFDGLASDDLGMSRRASNSLDKVSRERPDLLRPYKKELLTRVARLEHWMVRSRFCQILPRLDNLTPRERRRALAHVETFLSSPSSVVKATALDCLVQLSRAEGFAPEAAHVTELVDTCALRGDTPALRARARLMQKLLAKLARTGRT